MGLVLLEESTVDHTCKYDHTHTYIHAVEAHGPVCSNQFVLSVSQISNSLGIIGVLTQLFFKQPEVAAIILAHAGVLVQGRVIFQKRMNWHFLMSCVLTRKNVGRRENMVMNEKSDGERAWPTNATYIQITVHIKALLLVVFSIPLPLLRLNFPPIPSCGQYNLIIK